METRLLLSPSSPCSCLANALMSGRHGACIPYGPITRIPSGIAPRRPISWCGTKQPPELEPLIGRCGRNGKEPGAPRAPFETRHVSTGSLVQVSKLTSLLLIPRKRGRLLGAGRFISPSIPSTQCMLPCVRTRTCTVLCSPARRDGVETWFARHSSWGVH